MACTARPLVIRSFGLATAGLLSPRGDADFRIAHGLNEISSTSPVHLSVGVVEVQPRKRAHMVDIFVGIVSVILVMADEIRKDAGPADAAVEWLFGVGVTGLLRPRLARFPIALEAPRRPDAPHRRHVQHGACMDAMFLQPFVSGRGLIS